MAISDIRVGILGYGTGGRVFHAPLIRAVGDLQLTAIVTTDSERQARARLRAAAHEGPSPAD